MGICRQGLNFLASQWGTIALVEEKWVGFRRGEGKLQIFLIWMQAVESCQHKQGVVAISYKSLKESTSPVGLHNAHFLLFLAHPSPDTE